MDAPKSLADSSARKARLAALSQPHVAPLAAYVQRLRQAAGHTGRVPDFDPLDGGILAECLFLLEAPGGRAVGSGFVSRNNPDETAKNFFLLNQEAGLSRACTVTWNVVRKRREDPCCHGSRHQGIFAASKGTSRVASSSPSCRPFRSESTTSKVDL